MEDNDSETFGCKPLGSFPWKELPEPRGVRKACGAQTCLLHLLHWRSAELARSTAADIARAATTAFNEAFGGAVAVLFLFWLFLNDLLFSDFFLRRLNGRHILAQ